MAVTPFLFGAAAAAATLLGGVLALRLRHRIVPVLGLTAGIVVGVAVFDLVPEAIALGGDRWPAPMLAGMLAGGLVAYALLDRVLGRAGSLPARWRAHLGPATLTLHSLLDGLGIGLAFQIDGEAGGLIALAVLTHDIADGVNVVGLCLAAENAVGARLWLALNGIAPLAGVLLGQRLAVPAAALAPLLAAFAGVFLYIGGCELMPRSYARDPRPRTLLAGLGGLALMFVVTALPR